MSLKRAFREGASSCRVGPAFVCANGLIKNALLGRVAMNTNEIAIASSNPTKRIKEFDLTLSNRKLKIFVLTTADAYTKILLLTFSLVPIR